MGSSKIFKNPIALILLLSSLFFVLFLIVSGIFFISKTSPKSGSSGGSTSTFFSTPSVGVVELNGIILDSRKTLARLERFELEDQIKAVVLRINSPGGVVAPSQEIYQAVQNFPKPLIVSMGTMAASGAYYIAMGAKTVYANPGTLTGSIGVVMEFANLEKLYEWAKIHRYVIKSGKFKDAGSEFRGMSDEEKQLFQKMSDDILLQFMEAVAKGRKKEISEISQIADGRVFSGNQAKKLGLVDELGSLQDAILEAAKQGGITDRPNVIYAEKQKKSLMDLVLDDPSPNEQSHAGASQVVDQLEAWVGSLLGQRGFSNASSLSSEFVPGVYWIWSAGR